MPVPTDLLVIGLGYVGLPLAREAAFSGLTVVGYDLNTEMVAALNAGRSHVGDVPASDVAEMLGKGFRATSREEEAGDPDTVVICVPTPLSADNAPDLSAVRGAVEVTGRMLRPDMLVVLESTTYPGTTDEVVRPLLEKASGLTAGVDFWLGILPLSGSIPVIRITPSVTPPRSSAARHRPAPTRRSGSTASSVIRWSGPDPRAKRR